MVRGVGWGLLAGIVTLVASVWHQAVVNVGPLAAFPLGLILALAAVAAVAVAARAVSNYAGLVGAAVGAFAAAQATALGGPGGDVLVQGDVAGFLFVAGAPVLTLLAVLCPAAWFRRRR
ncbi:MAG: hypothetical protein LBD90_01990 [Bifidobacteriaceae bacterium]|nr:hypothetical protein [Bifidobacteriaceae bacterium]